MGCGKGERIITFLPLSLPLLSPKQQTFPPQTTKYAAVARNRCRRIRTPFTNSSPFTSYPIPPKAETRRHQCALHLYQIIFPLLPFSLSPFHPLPPRLPASYPQTTETPKARRWVGTGVPVFATASSIHPSNSISRKRITDLRSHSPTSLTGNQREVRGRKRGGSRREG